MNLKQIEQIMIDEDQEIFKILDRIGNECKHKIHFKDCIDNDCQEKYIRIKAERLVQEILLK